MADAKPSCQELMQNLPQGLLGLGAHGEVVQMNPAAGRLLGVDPEQAVGHAFSQVFASRLKQGEELFKTIDAAWTKGTTISGLVIPLGAGKDQVHISLTAKPLSPDGLEVVLDDVSQQEQNRQSLQKRHDQMANKAVSLAQEKDKLLKNLKRHTRLHILAALAIIVVFAVSGWYTWTRTHVAAYVEEDLGHDSEGKAQRNVFKARIQPLSSSISLSGSVEPYETINLLSPFAGRVLKRRFGYGQKVAKGALLIKLDTSELEMKLRDARVAAIKAQENYHKLQNWKNSDTVLQAQRGLNKAKNDLEVTEQKLQESQMLFKRGIIPLDEYRSLKEQVINQKISLDTLKDQLRAAIDKGSKKNLLVARLQLNNAMDKLAKLQRQIKRASITAPVVGVVIKPPSSQGGKNSKLVEEGYEVSQGQVLVALGNLERLSVTTQVGELNVAKLKKGQEVKITSYAFPGVSLKGKIDSVSSQANRSGGDGGPPTFTVKVVTAKLNPKEQGKLRLGMSAELEVEIFSNPKALVVPINAVRSGPKGEHLVTLVLPGGKKRDAEVKTGVTTPAMVEITGGIKAGDQVLLPSDSEGS